MTINNDSNHLPSHYIGVGASAGGLEALQDFFGNMPNNTGATFIVVQHLSPDFKSMMPELLGKYTSMPIEIAIDGMTLVANQIYLMPPRISMTINEGVLTLVEHFNDGHLHLPIDIFLSSLAKDKKHRAVGVVLSGTGSDGTRGIKDLKEMGGLVIVQEPSSAKFDGMPISAYNTGLADLLLPPQEIGNHLVSFISHPLISGNKESIRYSLGDNTDILAEIFKLLKEQSGINFAQYKASTVARRIERRMGINQIEKLDVYVRLLHDSPRELQTLSKELLIGVTSFFRDADAFAEISEAVMTSIVSSAREKNESIRIWVAGCSSGEEAYSIAILLDEEMRRQEFNGIVKIFATDVDPDAIAIASAGVYSEDIRHEISPERIEKYFSVQGDNYVVKKQLRQMVVFATHNMIEDAPFSNINMVSCRNVLIYFQHGAQKKVLSSLYFSLQRNGYLFLGGSESLGDLQSHFKPLSDRLKIFTKTSNSRVPIGSSSPLRDVVQANQYDMSMSTMPLPSTMPSRPLIKSSLTRVHERIIREHAPACIILSEVLDAIHVYGDVSAYTKGVREGKISNNIKEMVVDDLSVAISTALHRCEKSGEDVLYKDVVIQTSDNEHISVDLAVFWVKDGDLANSPHYYVVQFIPHESEEKAPPSTKKESFTPSEQTRQRIADLEQELLKKQEHLQIVVEELETTNEELQSANEELMSANEELQSTNEELQSVNEELYTVNSEYQEKIYELTEANDDLDSVINATDIGIIFLDKELTIRKYTPQSANYFNVCDRDLGRPFHHLSHVLVYDDLLVDVANVNKGSEVVEKEILDKEGNILFVRIMPYESIVKKSKIGILITITNIPQIISKQAPVKQEKENAATD